MRTEIRVPDTTGCQSGALRLTTRELSTEPSKGGSVQGGSEATEAPVEKEEDDPRKMLAELESSVRQRKLVSVDIDEIFTGSEQLRRELSALFFPGRDESLSFGTGGLDTPPKFENYSQPEARQHEAPLAKESLPYAVALQLEKAECDWEGVTQFTTYLFSNGPNGYQVQQEKERCIQQANDKLNEHYQQFLEDEKDFLAAEETARLRRCVVVTNIAADAEEDDICDELASHFKFHVQVLRFLY